MIVVVGSRNAAKKQAVKSAFSRAFPDHEIKCEVVDANSGVSSHPTDGSESIKGAINRAAHSKELRPGADYYVGLEGGLLRVADKTFEVGYAAIENDKGEVHLGLSSGVEISGKLLDSIESGQELSEALDHYFGLKDVGKANGFYGLTTNNLITRADTNAHAVIFALAPFLNPKYFD